MSRDSSSVTILDVRSYKASAQLTMLFHIVQQDSVLRRGEQGEEASDRAAAGLPQICSAKQLWQVTAAARRCTVDKS